MGSATQSQDHSPVPGCQNRAYRRNLDNQRTHTSKLTLAKGAQRESQEVAGESSIAAARKISAVFIVSFRCNV